MIHLRRAPCERVCLKKQRIIIWYENLIKHGHSRSFILSLHFPLSYTGHQYTCKDDIDGRSQTKKGGQASTPSCICNSFFGVIDVDNNTEGPIPQRACHKLMSITKLAKNAQKSLVFNRDCQRHHKKLPLGVNIFLCSIFTGLAGVDGCVVFDSSIDLEPQASSMSWASFTLITREEK